jgi:Asp-tRNA(Asn)/Glu-tRNA(Gln) amidotransferase A subunit family amidase
VKNVRTTAGSKVLADYISQKDVAVIEQLRKGAETWM